MNPTPIAKIPEAPARERRVPVLTPEALNIHASAYMRNTGASERGVMIENGEGGGWGVGSEKQCTFNIKIPGIYTILRIYIYGIYI